MDDDLLRRVRMHDSAPAHVSVVMDGNGRWARERSLPLFEAILAFQRRDRRFGRVTA